MHLCCSELAEVWSVICAERTQFASIFDYVLELTCFTHSGGTISAPAANDAIVSSSEPSMREETQQLEYTTLVDTGAGASVKLVTNRLCALLGAVAEICKVGRRSFVCMSSLLAKRFRTALTRKCCASASRTFSAFFSARSPPQSMPAIRQWPKRPSNRQLAQSSAASIRRPRSWSLRRSSRF